MVLNKIIIFVAYKNLTAHLIMTFPGIRKTDNLVYIILWVIACCMFIIHEMDDNIFVGAPLYSLRDVVRMLIVFFPFVFIFLLNNCLCLPDWLKKHNTKRYVFRIALMLLFVVGYEYVFQLLGMHHHANHDPEVLGMYHKLPPPPCPGLHHKHLISMPMINSIIYAAVVIGGNVTIALGVKHMTLQMDHQRLLSVTTENRLDQLKMQINPHFYMNMLNAIHGMIEINPERAQEMVFDMSQLMRYMLYESSQPEIALNKEVAFLKEYLKVMRMRCPSDKVKITSEFPADYEMRGIKMPPLLFLVFIENAFKHGVTFQKDCFIAIKMKITKTTLFFSCVNSKRNEETSENDIGGIGLNNVRQRLAILYGDRMDLQISETENTYTINLTIPKDETKNNVD